MSKSVKGQVKFSELFGFKVVKKPITAEIRAFIVSKVSQELSGEAKKAKGNLDAQKEVITKAKVRYTELVEAYRNGDLTISA